MIKKLKIKSEFSRNVLTLMTGTTIAQAIPIAVSPILTRLYTPDDFGVFALYLSISGVIGVIVTGRYELAIMLPSEENDAKHIFILSLLIAVIISLITFIIIFVFNHEISELLNTDTISKWLYFIPVTVLTMGIYQSSNYWLNRQKSYKELAINKSIQAVLIGSGNIGFGLSKLSTNGLIVGYIIGQGIASISLGYKILLSNPNIFKNISYRKIYFLAKKYKDFLKFNTLHSFVATIKESFVSIMIVAQYTSTLLGMYYLVIRVMKAPVGLVGYSISQVFYKKATESYNDTKDIYKLVKRLMVILALVSIIPSLVFMVFSIDIFTFVFGKSWEIAGYYAQALIIYIYLHFIASPLGIVPIITGKQKQALLWGILESIIFILSFLVGHIVFKDLYKTLWLLSLVMLFYFPIYFFWILKISKVENEK